MFLPLRGLVGVPSNTRPSLKVLSRILLRKEIQKGQHSSLVDARAAMEIYKQFEAAWEHHLLECLDGDKCSFWLHDQFWPEDI